MSGPAEIAGIPIADSLLEQLRANASIEPVLVDDDGTPIAIGKRSRALSPKIVRAVLLRDQRCRRPVAADPASRSITCDPGPGAAPTTSPTWRRCARPVTPTSSPTAPYALVGNPNQPDGLERVHLDDLTPEQRQQVGRPPPRAGPNAA